VVFVRQRFETDCGIAAYAMVLDLPYEVVFKIAFPGDIVDLSFGLSGKQQYTLLGALDIRFREYINVRNVRAFKHNTILSVKPDRQWHMPMGHAVVYDAKRQVVLDPVYGERSVEWCTSRGILWAAEILGKRRWYHRLLGK
jgi:hypothetical protein